MRARVKPVGFRLPELSFDSSLTDLVMELEYLRRKPVIMSTEPYYYEKFRNIFHDLDAMGSARVDGNKTGISKFLEAKEDDTETKGRKTVEIDKISEAMSLIDQNINETVIFQGFFTELHRLIRDGITNSSSQFAGRYRHSEARPQVTGSSSPGYHLVETYMDKLITLAGKNGSPKYDAIKAAFVHQRYLWIHPFREANGFTARLLTYTMLLKRGFGGEHNRIINPTYCFCHDPEKYLALVRKADSDRDQDILAFIEFALKGMVRNFEKMDELTNYDFVRENIFAPAFKHPMFDRVFNDQDRLLMDIAMEKQIFQAGDIKMYFPQRNPSEISKMLKWLKDKDWIVTMEDNQRKYAINLDNKYLIKFVVSKLDKAGCIPFV